jgi:hypothetical protein
MRSYIKKLLREGLIGEEYSDGVLYGYHVTSLSNWGSIKSGGLNVGHRSMQGKGLYAFYDYNHAVRYGEKGEIVDPIIIKFEISHPKRFLILNMDIAKKIYGDKYHLIDQINSYFYGGLDRFYNDYVKLVNHNMSIDDLKGKLEDIVVNNSEMKQRTFVFNLIPSSLNDELNLIWDGNYGLEFRINNLNYIKILGYKNLDGNSEVTLSIKDKIPENEEFVPLIEFFNSNPSLDTIGKAYKVVKEKLNVVRSNREWDYYDKILKLLNKIK